MSRVPGTPGDRGSLAREPAPVTSHELLRAASALERLRGQVCRKVIPGAKPLTILALDFGDEVGSRASRFTPGAVITLYQFWLRTSGAWRLDAPDRVLCSFDDEKPRPSGSLAGVPNERRSLARERGPASIKGGEVRAALAALEGQTVLRVDFTPPAGDLAIHFERGQVFRVFGCVAAGACGGDYFFIDDTPGRKQSFQVGPRGAIDFDWPHAATAEPAGEIGEPGD